MEESVNSSQWSIPELSRERRTYTAEFKHEALQMLTSQGQQHGREILVRIQHRIGIPQLQHDLLGRIPLSSFRHLNGLLLPQKQCMETLITSGSVFKGMPRPTR
jgi:hypothetical protein